MGSPVLIGSLTASYSAAEVAAGKTPPLGYVYEDRQNHKTYIFVKNISATALSLKRVCIGYDASAFTVNHSATLSDPKVAGVRPAGAEDLDQNESGYIQVKGNGTCTWGNSARATVEGEGVVLDDDTDTGRIGGVLLDTTGTVNEANVELVVTSMAGVFGKACAAVNTADADVEVELDCKYFSL